MSDLSDSESDTDCNFNVAAEALQKIHSKLSQEDMLEIYGLYKQATCGQCNIPKPGIFQTQARSKWNAWNALSSMDQQEAKRLYVEKVSRLDPHWDTDLSAKGKIGWVVHSVHTTEEDLIDNKNKTSFDFVKENNLEGLEKTLVKEKIDDLDENGMALIHWAADRNAKEILEFLLGCGASVNLQDSDGQTCLHYASSCGHYNCLEILIKFGADKNVRDNDKAIPLEVAYDDNIRSLLNS